MNTTRPRKAVVIGGGRSSLTLATGLSADGWQVRVMTRGTMAETLGGRTGLTQLTMPLVRGHENALGLDLWTADAPPIETAGMHMADPAGDSWSFAAPLPLTELSLPGRGQTPVRMPVAATSIDTRLTSAYWRQHIADLPGATIQPGDVSLADLASLVRYRLADLIVVATGADPALAGLFEPDSAHAGGASARVVTQVHLDEAETWQDQDARVVTCPDGEIMVYPVLTHTPLTPEQVRAHLNVDARPTQVSPYRAMCVQVLARPGGGLDPTTAPAVRELARPPGADPLAPGEDPIVSEYLGRHGTQALAAWRWLWPRLEEIDPTLVKAFQTAQVREKSMLLRRLEPQVRRPITEIDGVPVLGIGDVTNTVEHVSAQGAAASTLVATTVREQLRHLSPEQLREPQALAGTWEAYWVLHGAHTRNFGAFVNGYWSGALPEGTVEAFRTAVSTREGATAWAEGLNDPHKSLRL